MMFVCSSPHQRIATIQALLKIILQIKIRSASAFDTYLWLTLTVCTLADERDGDVPVSKAAVLFVC